MNFDQGQFNFDANGPEDGYRKWREELDAKKRAFEARWGVILGRKVRVSLRDHQKEISGILEWINDPKKPDGKPSFRIKSIVFTIPQIESIVQVDE